MCWRPRQLRWQRRTSIRNIQRSSKPHNRRITILFGLQKRWESTTPPATPTTHQIPRRPRFRIVKPRPTSTITVHSKEILGWPQISHCRKNDRQSRTRIQSGRWDLKWRAGYRIIWIEHEGCYLHIENQATGKIRSCNVKDIVFETISELWNVNPEFGRASKFINYPNNLPDFTPDTQ